MIKQITDEEYVNFLHRNNARNKQISINKNGEHFGYFENEKLVGVISKLETLNTVRIKGFLVNQSHTMKGIGKKLIQHLLVENKTMTVFSTLDSRKLFKNLGFEVISEKNNNIAFMSKKASDEKTEISNELKEKINPSLIQIANVMLTEDKKNRVLVLDYLNKELKKLK